MVSDVNNGRGSLWSRIAKGTVAQGFSQVARIVMRFIEVPLLLHFWGAQMYGEWLILTAIPVYLAMTDIGFTNVARRDMAMLIARGDLQAALEVFQSIRLLIIMLSVGVFLIFLGLLLKRAVPWMFDSIGHASWGAVKRLTKPALAGVRGQGPTYEV